MCVKEQKLSNWVGGGVQRESSLSFARRKKQRGSDVLLFVVSGCGNATYELAHKEGFNSN